VNTLVIPEDRVLASSKDAKSVTSQIEAADRSALVLGAGGAAKAVAHALERAGAHAVSVVSRRDQGWPPSGVGVDVLVNCTPVKEDVIVAPYPGMQIVDLAYNPDGSPTALVAAARLAGCETVVDGLDVLLAQGAASFERWTGRPAPFAAMADGLRRAAA
jgi:shikimate dehydrogenase